MRSLVASGLLLVPLALLCGCGASTPPPTAATPAPPQPSSPPVEKVEAPKAAPRAAKRERPATERAKVSQLFQVPQVTRTGTRDYADSRHDGAAPQIRLLGFSKLDGQLRALVQVKSETLPVEQGDVIDGVEVVSIDENNGVSFQYVGQRWTSQLFEKLDTRPVVIARAPAPSPADPSSQALPADNPSPDPSN